MIFEIKLPVEEAQNKVRVREESHGETCDRPPISDFLIPTTIHSKINA
jgi:hypothetical protein